MDVWENSSTVSCFHASYQCRLILELKLTLLGVAQRVQMNLHSFVHGRWSAAQHQHVLGGGGQHLSTVARKTTDALGQQERADFAAVQTKGASPERLASTSIWVPWSCSLLSLLAQHDTGGALPCHAAAPCNTCFQRASIGHLLD